MSELGLRGIYTKVAMKTLNLEKLLSGINSGRSLVDSSRNAIPALSGLKCSGLWSLNRKNDLVVYNHERAKSRRPKGWPFFGLQEGRNFRRFLAHAATYIRIPIVRSRRGYSDSPAIVGTIRQSPNHALYCTQISSRREPR